MSRRRLIVVILICCGYVACVRALLSAEQRLHPERPETKGFGNEKYCIQTSTTLAATCQAITVTVTAEGIDVEDAGHHPALPETMAGATVIDDNGGTWPTTMDAWNQATTKLFLAPPGKHKLTAEVTVYRPKDGATTRARQPATVPGCTPTISVVGAEPYISAVPITVGGNALSAATACDTLPKYGTRTYNENYARATFYCTVTPADLPWSSASQIRISATVGGGEQAIPPYNTGTGTVTLLTTESYYSAKPGELLFEYDAFDEPKSAKYPVPRSVKFVPTFGGCEIGDELRATALPVFDMLVRLHLYDDAIKYVIWKYDIDVSVFQQEGNSLAYDPDETGCAHTYATVNALDSENGARNCHVGSPGLGDENLLASTLIHEAVHGGQPDSYFRWYTSERTAEMSPYNTEYNSLARTGLRGVALVELQAWCAWVNDTTGTVPRPQGGR